MQLQSTPIADLAPLRHLYGHSLLVYGRGHEPQQAHGSSRVVGERWCGVNLWGTSFALAPWEHCAILAGSAAIMASHAGHGLHSS